MNLKGKILILGSIDASLRIELAKNFSKKGFETIIAGSEEKTIFLNSNIKYYYFDLSKNLNFFKMIKTIFAIKLIIEKCKPDIVQSFDADICFYSALACKMSSYKVNSIATINGLGRYFSTLSIKNIFGRLIYLFTQFLTARLHHILIFQNHENKKLFKKFHLCNKKNIRVIYGSGVDFKNQIEFNKKIDNKKSTEVLLVTRIIKEKGIIEFLKIAENFDKYSKNFSFSLIGGVDEKNKYLKKIIKTYDKRLSNFKWFGELRHEQVNSMLSKSDIFLYPSFYSEGIPRVLLEAASHNLYIISYDMPGCNQIVIDKVNGELIDCDQPLDTFIQSIKNFQNNNDKETKDFNKFLIKKKFDIEVIADNYLSVYSDIINKRIEK